MPQGHRYTNEVEPSVMHNHKRFPAGATLTLHHTSSRFTIDIRILRRWLVRSTSHAVLVREVYLFASVTHNGIVTGRCWYMKLVISETISFRVVAVL